MHTLHEFLNTTKVITYVISVGSMVLFTIFWLFLERKKTKTEKNG